MGLIVTIADYNKDWEKFRVYIEKKIKGKCELNNKNWLKLRDFHFEEFIKKIPHPYGFLFKMIYMSTVHKEIPCIHKVYTKYRKEKQEQLISTFRLKSKASAYRKYR